MEESFHVVPESPRHYWLHVTDTLSQWRVDSTHSM